MFVASVLTLAVITALACALPGMFIVLRGQSMLVDGIGHAVFPGIALGYLFTRDLSSPLLVVGATVTGLVVVASTEWLRRTNLLTGDAPLGLIFPAIFALGVLIVSGKFTNVHLDTHVALTGDLNLAVFMGPKYIVVMATVLLTNAVLLWSLRRPLTMSTFDPEFARLAGVPSWINAVFVLIVSATVTAAFNAAGALLVLSLVVAPAATARIFSVTMAQMVIWTCVIAAGVAVVGFYIAYFLQASTSAAMATFYGLTFFAVLVTHRFMVRRRTRAQKHAS